MRSLVLFPVLFAATAFASFAAAQSQDGDSLDIDAIRASASEHRAEAEALAKNIRLRGEKLKTEAQQTQEKARTNRQRYSQKASKQITHKKDEAFDFDAMIAAEAEMAKADLGSQPRFIVFVSLSMPPAALRVLIPDVAAAGGVTVLRGFPGGKSRNLTRLLSRFAGDGEYLPSLGIDPRLFRAFEIRSAPTFVMASSDFDLCDGFDCVDTPPPHDRMSGNVSAEYALEKFALGGGPGSRLAALHLQKLKENRSR